jgi:hypothetical protein
MVQSAQIEPMTPDPNASSRDNAVVLLEDLFRMVMRQDSADNFDPGFRQQIADTVDAIIAASKPGHGPPGHSLVSDIEHAVTDAVEAVENAVEGMIPGERRKRLTDRRKSPDSQG